MRQIKFRAWNSRQKKMYSPEWLYNPMESDKETILMQFTGLLDKNGKEIFEGDILRTEREADAEVVFGNGSFVGKEIDGWDPMTNYYILNDSVRSSEVIGNIYENPNHLKDKE